MKRMLASCMTILLLIGIAAMRPLTATGADHVINISTEEEFLEFAENCSYDDYSNGLTVELKKDLNLKNKEFDGIPYFGGVFNGNGHTIKNVSISSDGTVKGFIRYTSEQARISELHVNGRVTPGGDRNTVGGLVGDNKGTLHECTFEGTVSGVNSVGGLCGISSGLVDQCSFQGRVTGEHKIGGVVGDNTGIVSQCRNDGQINHEMINVSSQPAIKSFHFDVAELSESDFLDITDIGGICGISVGVVTGCENSGTVGYEKTGYNVGGIAGRQNGKVENCINKGQILGRKDVGGIVGQAEPYAVWDFSDSKLKELQDAIQSIRIQAAQLKQDASGSGKEIRIEFNRLEESIQQASKDADDALRQISANYDKTQNAAVKTIDEIRAALEKHDHHKTKTLLRQLKAQLSGNTEIDINELLELLSEIRQEEKEHLEDHLNTDDSLSTELEEIIAAMEFQQPDFDKLYQDMKQLYTDAKEMKDLVGNEASQVKEDTEAFYEAVSSLTGALTTTADNFSEVQTKLQTDISATEPKKFDRGIIVSCTHKGAVTGDTNVGGIAGSVSFEIEFDAEDKLNLSDYLLTNARYLIFSVIEKCQSGGEITAKKEAAGGILGHGDFGSIRECISSGTVGNSEGDYSGGIVGISNGMVDQSYARTLLYGKHYVGGIAGSGKDLKDCKSFSFIKSTAQECGAIAGELTGSVSDCYFVENEYGGIDGVSYKGKAQPVSYTEMLKYDDIPELFRKITVTFLVKGKTFQVIEIPFGGRIEKLPEVPMDGIRYWKWDDFDNEKIYYSFTVDGEYKNPKTTIATSEEVPLYLAEGNFYEGQTLTAEEVDIKAAQAYFKKRQVLKVVRLSVSDYSGSLTFRMYNPEKVDLYKLNDKGNYEPLDYEQDGSYLFFKAENNRQIVTVKHTVLSGAPWLLIIAAGVTLILVIVIVILVCHKRKQRRKKQALSVSPEIQEDHLVEDKGLAGAAAVSGDAAKENDLET